HVFKFIGDEVQTIDEAIKRVRVGEIGVDAQGDATHRRFWGRIEEAELQSQRIAGERKHVTELAAAEDTDVHADFLFLVRAAGREGSKAAKTFLVCDARNCRSASRTRGYFAPRIAAASSAELMAPAFPIARVPTGMPA